MLENGVPPRWNLEPCQLRRGIGETRHFDAAQIVELALVARRAADADRRLAELRRNRAHIGHEALPLRRNLDRRLPRAGRREADDAKRLAVDRVRRVEIGACRRLRRDRLSQREAVEAAALAQRFRRQAELVAKRAGKGLVRAIAGVERDREDVSGPGAPAAMVRAASLSRRPRR